MKIHRASRGAEKETTSSSCNQEREKMEDQENSEQITNKGKG